MNVKIVSDFQFTLASIQYTPDGELCLTLSSAENAGGKQYQYTASLGSGQAEERPKVSLLEYARAFAANSSVKDSTKDSYRLMCNHLEAYGDRPLDEVTTDYLQQFIAHLYGTGLMTGTVRLYFQKLTCVLHDAYRNGLFDDRILQRVKRPKREQRKKCFLTEGELRRLMRQRLPEEYGNIRTMFLFSCLTGLRYGDVQGLRWSDVKRSGNHLHLEFHQQKTDSHERLPLCAEAETLLRGLKRSGEHVFKAEANQRVNTVLKRWCREARITKPVSFHSARHTFCVLLLTKEVPIFTVQQLMCHSDIGATKVYADLLNKTKAKALKRLPPICAA